MTPEQAIAALKGADRQIFGTNRVVLMSDDNYHALLALLEGLRWKRVSEPPPNVYEAVLISWFPHEGHETIDDFHSIRGSLCNDDLWMPLPSPPDKERLLNA